MAPAETRTLSAASQPDLMGAGRIASGDDDAVEALGIGVAGRLAQLGAALTHALFHPREILELTRVAGERPRGAALLLLTDGRQLRGGHRAVARALVAVGDDDEADILAFLDELRHRAARAELAVVGMGGDHQDAPDGIAHALGYLPSNLYLGMPSSSIPIRPRRRAIIALPMAADRGRRIAVIVLVVLLLLPLPAT